MWRKHPKGDKAAIFHFFIVALLIWLIMGGVGPVSGASMAWKFRSDLDNSGVYDDGGTRPDGALLWSYTTGDVVHSSPAIVNDVVYVGSGDGNLYALDAGTGTLLWNYTTGNFVYSSPAIVNDVVYVGSSDDRLYALDAGTGALLWSYSTGSDIESSPSVTDGMVYVGSDDHNLYALDAGTGTLLWNYTTGNSVETSPVLVNGVAMVGSADRTLYALNATIGSLLWKFTTGGVIHSSPAVANGIVYVGSDDYNLYALNMATGTLLWNYTTGNYVDSSPAIASGVVYVGSVDRNLYALDAEMGTLLWKYTTGGQVDSSPAIANGIAYVGSNDNNLYALDAATGTLFWNYTTAGNVDSSPAVVDGIVYFGSSDGTIYALGVSPDTPPPGITNLRNTTYQQNRITWNWTDPVSADFDHVIVYLEGIFQENVTKGTESFTASGLTAATTYTLRTRTGATSGLINQTWVNNTAMTAPESPVPVPPASITNLHNTTYQQNTITWVWTDPASADFDRVMVYLNDVFQGNVTAGNQTFTATALSSINIIHYWDEDGGDNRSDQPDLGQQYSNDRSLTKWANFYHYFKWGLELFSTPIRLEQGHSQFSQVFSETEAEKLS